MCIKIKGFLKYICIYLYCLLLNSQYHFNRVEYYKQVRLGYCSSLLYILVTYFSFFGVFFCYIWLGNGQHNMLVTSMADVRLSQSLFSFGIFFFWERKKIGAETDFSGLLSAIFFRPVFWLEVCRYFSQK